MSDPDVDPVTSGQARAFAAEVFARRNGTGRTAGWWGVLVGLGALATVVGALVYSYFYLRLNVAEWPPGGRSPLGFTGSLVALGLLAGAVAAAQAPRWRTGRAAIAASVATVALGAGFVVVQTLDLLGADLVIDRHAYDAIVIVLHAAGLISVAAGVVAVGWGAWLDATLGDGEARAATAAYLAGAAGLWVATWAVLYLFPHVA